jgi:hypothetical protein
MQHHFARVVFGACLLAAASAAQAPASLFASTAAGETPTGVFAASALDDGAARDGAARDGAAPDGVAADEAADASGSHRFAPRNLRQPVRPLRLPQETQDENLYTMRTIFRQNFGDFMDRRERFNPQLELRAKGMPNGRIKDENGSFDMLGYEFDLDLPMLVSTDGYLIFGAYYNSRRYQTTNSFGARNNSTNNTLQDTRNFGNETLVAAGFKFGFGVFLDSNILFEMQTNPGVWSDLDDTLHHEDFDFPSHALFTIRAVDPFFFKIGARYNQVYEDAPWLPMLGFSWEIVEGFRLDLLAPESVEMSFWPAAGTGILFGCNVTGGEYHVHTRERVNERADVRVQEVIAYLGLLQRLTDNVNFAAKAGLVVAGDYSLTTGERGFDAVDGPLDQGFWAEFSMGVAW